MASSCARSSASGCSNISGRFSHRPSACPVTDTPAPSALRASGRSENCSRSPGAPCRRHWALSTLTDALWPARQFSPRSAASIVRSVNLP
ncbi:Uncharacterised protein [Bordetella pertussis]|nr:Uncharacterised protein [Bordetella pertussis]